MANPRSRVLVLNWRDPWHPEGGGSETLRPRGRAQARAAGTDVTFPARYPAPPVRDPRRHRLRRRGGHLTVYLWAALDARFWSVRPARSASWRCRTACRSWLASSRAPGTWSSFTTSTGSSGRSWASSSPGSAGSWSRGWPSVSTGDSVHRGQRGHPQRTVDLGVRPRTSRSPRTVNPAPDFDPTRPGPTPRLVVLAGWSPKAVEHAMDAVAALRTAPEAAPHIMGSGWWRSSCSSADKSWGSGTSSPSSGTYGPG